MQAIKLEITKYIDNHYTGFIEDRFFDANNIEHIIHEKIPVVTSLDLDENSNYPQEGMIACEVLNEYIGFDVETIDGCTKFKVFEDQLTSF